MKTVCYWHVVDGNKNSYRWYIKTSGFAIFPFFLYLKHMSPCDIFVRVQRRKMK
jgi:hypothetical protein